MNESYAEFEVAGHKYRAGRLDAMTQFHVTRRLGPALVVAGVTFKMMQEGMRTTLEDWVAVAGPIMEVVSKMSDTDVDYIIFRCLAVVQRRDGDRWAPVLTQDRDALMYQDLDMAEMLRLTVEVLRGNLANFAKGLSAGGSSSESSVVPSPTGTKS